MGLTKEQWQIKRLKELKEIIKKKGTAIDNMIYLKAKEPLIIKDICVFGIGLINDEIIFGDYLKDGFRGLKKGTDTERKYLEEIISEIA